MTCICTYTVLRNYVAGEILVNRLISKEIDRENIWQINSEDIKLVRK